MTDKTLPMLLWKGTCPRSGMHDAATRTFRCVAAAPGPGSSLAVGHPEVLVEEWTEDAMGTHRWAHVDFGPLRHCVLEEAVLSIVWPSRSVTLGP